MILVFLFIILGLVLIPFMIVMGAIVGNWLFGDIIKHNKKFRGGRKW